MKVCWAHSLPRGEYCLKPITFSTVRLFVIYDRSICANIYHDIYTFWLIFDILQHSFVLNFLWLSNSFSIKWHIMVFFLFVLYTIYYIPRYIQ